MDAINSRKAAMKAAVRSTCCLAYSSVIMARYVRPHEAAAIFRCSSRTKASAFRRKLTGAAIAFFLNRRTRDQSVGAVDTALTLDGLHAVTTPPCHRRCTDKHQSA